MSAKVQLASMLDFMGESEASQILQFAKDMFMLKPKTWDDIEEDEPMPDEAAIFADYYAKKNV